MSMYIPTCCGILKKQVAYIYWMYQYIATIDYLKPFVHVPIALAYWIRE